MLKPNLASPCPQFGNAGARVARAVDTREEAPGRQRATQAMQGKSSAEAIGWRKILKLFEDKGSDADFCVKSILIY